MINGNIKIQVLGSGCPTCKKLFELTKKAVQELEIEVDIEYITDMEKIIEMGIMSLPVLTINEKPVIIGYLPDIKEIKDLIKNHE